MALRPAQSITQLYDQTIYHPASMKPCCWLPRDCGGGRQKQGETTQTRVEFLWWAPFCLFPITAPDFLELVKNDKNLWQNLLSTGRETLQGYSDFPQPAALWRGQGTGDPRGLDTLSNFTGPGSSVTFSSSEEIKDKRCYVTSSRSQSKLEAGWDYTVRTRVRLQRWTGCRWGVQTPSRPLPARWANHSKRCVRGLPSLPSPRRSHSILGLSLPRVPSTLWSGRGAEHCVQAAEGILF